MCLLIVTNSKEENYYLGPMVTDNKISEKITNNIIIIIIIIIIKFYYGFKKLLKLNVTF